MSPLFLVIPAKAGIQTSVAGAVETWVPACAGTMIESLRIPK